MKVEIRPDPSLAAAPVSLEAGEHLRRHTGRFLGAGIDEEGQ